MGFIPFLIVCFAASNSLLDYDTNVNYYPRQNFSKCVNVDLIPLDYNELIKLL